MDYGASLVSISGIAYLNDSVLDYLVHVPHNRAFGVTAVRALHHWNPCGFGVAATPFLLTRLMLCCFTSCLW